MFDAVSKYGVVGRAVQNKKLDLCFWNPRDFANNKHNSVDDRPYGGGPGMVMQYQPVSDAIDTAKKQNKNALVIYLSPQGNSINQQELNSLLCQDGLIFLNGRYEGIDERIIEAKVDREYSLGDFVLSGGELASMVLIDCMARLMPGVLGHDESALQDSFMEGLLDCPHYTRPEVVEDLKVPDVLLSGDHKAIKRWRLKQSLGRSYLRRPDLIQKLELTSEQKVLLNEYLDEINHSTRI